MSNSLKAKIAPAVLVWARSSAGYEVEEAAAKLKVTSERLAAWERGDDQPSIPQLRSLAGLYKRPLAVFYLPEPPLYFQPMHDFRRLPEFGSRRYSPGLMLEMRTAQQRRILALELLDEVGDKPTPFQLTATGKVDPEQAGLTIRQALGITDEMQRRWKDTLTAFRHWRSSIEAQGVLVFEATRFESDEASGFAYWADALPFIVINHKDEYPRRIFSLLHELAHLMLHQSGVSESDIESPRAPADAKIEMFCNQVAAAALMPRDAFLAETLIAQQPAGARDWPDEVIDILATRYSVSREAIVRRLLRFGRTSEAFYGRKRAQYATEYQARRAREREEAKAKDAGIPRNMPRETIAAYGRPFVRAVLQNYYQERITLSDVSGYLGVKVRHIPAIEQQIAMA